MDRKRFTTLCLEHKITIAELEKKLNMSNGSLRKEGAIRSDRLLAVADYFGVSMDYLMGIDKTDIPLMPNGTGELLDLFSRATPEQRLAVLNLLRSFVAD